MRGAPSRGSPWGGGEGAVDEGATFEGVREAVDERVTVSGAIAGSGSNCEGG